MIALAAINGADVISNSWIVTGSAEALPNETALLELAYSLGSLIVFAAGNGSSDLVNTFPQNRPEVMSIAASTTEDKLAFFSNFGELVSVAAPGTEILSLKAARSTMNNASNSFNGGLRVANGTSMAAPHVAGVAALVKSYSPELTHDQIRAVIEDTAEVPVYSEFWVDTGDIKRIDAAAALNSLQAPAPKLTITGFKPDRSGIEVLGVNTGLIGQAYVLEFKAVSGNEWTQLESGMLSSWELGSEQSLGHSPQLGELAPGTYLFRAKTTLIDGRLEISDERAFSFKRAAILGIEDALGNEDVRVYKDMPFSVRADLLGIDSFSIELKSSDSSEWSSDRVSYLIPTTATPVAYNASIATLSFAELEAGSYDLRLTAQKGSELFQQSVAVTLDQASASVVVHGQFRGDKLLTADIDGDGVKEIITASTSGTYGEIAVIRADSTLQYFGDKSESYAASILAAGNLDEFPGEELFVVTQLGSQFSISVVKLADGSLQHLPGWPQTLPEGHFLKNDYTRLTAPIIADLDQDGVNEILVATHSAPSNLHIWVMNADGSPKSSLIPFQVPNSDSSVAGMVDLLPFDVDHDGFMEILVGARSGNLSSGTSYLRAYSLDGTEYLNSTWPIDIRAQSALTLSSANSFFPVELLSGDTQEDAEPEILVRTQWGEVIQFRADGSKLSNHIEAVGGNGASKFFALADLNGDQKLDIVATDNTSIFIIGVSNDAYPKNLSGYLGGIDTSVGSPVIGDVDGDGYPDIILTYQHQEPPSNDLQTGVIAFNLAGEEIFNYKTFGFGLSDSRGDSAVLSDFDNDGSLDLLVATDYRLSNTAVTRFRLPSPVSECTTHFPIFKYNTSRTGAVLAAPLCRIARSCIGDLNGDGTVDGPDLGIILGYFGSTNVSSDLNSDGQVDSADLGLLLGNWGEC